jgi:hypothetical protein
MDTDILDVSLLFWKGMDTDILGMALAGEGCGGSFELQ